MKRILKIIGVGLGVFLMLSLALGLWLHEPLPQGKIGLEADTLAKKMLNTLNVRAFEETRLLNWSFQKGAHRYQWNRLNQTCTVAWKHYEVLLDLNHAEKSKVKIHGEIETTPSNELIQKARDYFNNDSFWLVAPYKIFDAGTERRLVLLEDGTKALLVTYTQGGTTPGDSYLWLLDDQGMPKAFKMWVNIIPIGGIEASWSDWTTTQSGAMLPKSHELGPFTLSMGEVKGFR